MKYLAVIFLFFIFVNNSCAQQQQQQQQQIPVKVDYEQEKRSLIDDEETAIKIAEIILFSAYGEKIYKSLPFKAELINDNKVWFIRGTLSKEYNRGGVPFIQIQKKDCKVLKFGHGK